MAFRFHISQYLTRRAADWKAKGFAETLTDWAAAQRALEVLGRRPARGVQELGGGRRSAQPARRRQGVNERIMLRELLRRVDMMVILENKLDALVRLHTPWPPGLIGHAYQYDIASNLRPESLSGPNAGLDRGADPGGLCHDGLRPGVQAHAGRQALRVAGVRQADDDRRRRACRSRWCSAPSPARRMCCCGSPRPTRRRRSAACRRRISRRCRCAPQPAPAHPEERAKRRLEGCATHSDSRPILRDAPCARSSG